MIDLDRPDPWSGLGILRDAIAERPIFPFHLNEIDEYIF
jgi:hypothetical protein